MSDRESTGARAQSSQSPIHFLWRPTLVYGAFGLGAPLLAALGITGSRAPGSAAALWAGGLVGWTFFEYAFHRWGEHPRRFRRLLRPFLVEHAHHHAHPDAIEDFIYKLRESLPLAAAAIALFSLAAWSLGAGLLLGAGFCCGYLVYEWVHVASHSARFREGRPWLERWSALHTRHHWESANGCYGFVTSFWDRLLGTYHPPKA